MKIHENQEDVIPTSKPMEGNIQPPADDAEKEVIVSDHETDDEDDDDDEIIYSDPYIKNGPYTCSKCKAQFTVSQRFAGHVYAKHPRKNRRVKNKTRRRDLSLIKVSGGGGAGLNLVPISSEAVRGHNNVEVAASKVSDDKAGGEGHKQNAPPGSITLFGVKIKVDPYA